MNLRRLSVLFASLLLAGCPGWWHTREDPEVVEYVNIERYMGLWYEVASIPIRGQRGCVASTARYTLQDNGRVHVLNQCRSESFDGSLRQIEGTARIIDTDTNARLKITFFWPLSAQYWIVDLDEDYAWAVVSGPGIRTLWILSRTPCMEDPLYQQILGRLGARNFPVEALSPTPQQDPDGQPCLVSSH